MIQKKDLAFKKYRCDAYLICRLTVNRWQRLGADCCQGYDFLKSDVEKKII